MEENLFKRKEKIAHRFKTSVCQVAQIDRRIKNL